MHIDTATVERIAHLARLEFTEQEKEGLVKDMSKILDWMDKLNEINTDHVTPLIHMSAEVNVLRDDVVSSLFTHEQGLKNAPKKDSDYFRVPKVIDITD